MAQGYNLRTPTEDQIHYTVEIVCQAISLVKARLTVTIIILYLFCDNLDTAGKILNLYFFNNIIKLSFQNVFLFSICLSKDWENTGSTYDFTFIKQQIPYCLNKHGHQFHEK